VKWDTGATSSIPEYVRLTTWGGSDRQLDDVPDTASLWPPKKKFVIMKDLNSGATTYGTIEEIGRILVLSPAGVRSRIHKRTFTGGYYLFAIELKEFIEKTGRRYRDD